MKNIYRKVRTPGQLFHNPSAPIGLKCQLMILLAEICSPVTGYELDIVTTIPPGADPQSLCVELAVALRALLTTLLRLANGEDPKSQGRTPQHRYFGEIRRHLLPRRCDTGQFFFGEIATQIGSEERGHTGRNCSQIPPPVAPPISAALKNPQ